MSGLSGTNSTAGTRRAAVGEVLRGSRQAANITLEAAGAALTPPVTASYLSEVELGKRPCPAKRLAALCKLYKLDDEGKRAVYVAAGVLPPKTYAAVLKKPKTWVL